MRYAGRAAAGRVLADHLAVLELSPPVVVLALLRGGVPVAVQVARRLEAPLHPLPVRKVGAPGRPELAMGAVAMIGTTVSAYRNHDVLSHLSVDPATFDRALAAERTMLQRRAAAFVGDLQVDLSGQTVIIVDDGLATGSTMLAAVEVVRQQRPAAIVVACPVGASGAVAALRPHVQAVVCPSVPEPFIAVALAYADFRQLSDREVLDDLRR